nr:hypothetical protein BaRGS_010404 [Batillaria attramentaria]
MSSSSSGISSADHTPSPAYRQHSVSSMERRQQLEKERLRQQEIERHQLEGHQLQLQRQVSDPEKSDGQNLLRTLHFATDDDDEQSKDTGHVQDEQHDDMGSTQPEEQKQDNMDSAQLDKQQEDDDAGCENTDDQKQDVIDSTQANEQHVEEDSFAATVIPVPTTEVQERSDTTEQTQQPQPSRTFTPMEIQQHNHEVGWVEWVPHKGKVYDGNGFKSHFPSYIERLKEMQEEKRQKLDEEGSEEEQVKDESEEEKKTYLYDIRRNLGYWYELPPNESDTWKITGVAVLRAHGLSEEEIKKEIAPFLLGVITDTEGAPYWASVRNDVAELIQDIQNKDEDARTPSEDDYLKQLIRWKEKYEHADPPDPEGPPGEGDLNELPFPLPVDPDSLQVWLLEWQPFDTEVPEEGAWSAFELEKTDLGDPHEVFAETLRVDRNDLNLASEFTFDIEGDAAWDILPDDVVDKEEMTPGQEEIHAAREKRTDLDDPERMRRRREKLAEHFIKVREIPPDVVEPFLQWADLMEKNKEELEKLC